MASVTEELATQLRAITGDFWTSNATDVFCSVANSRATKLVFDMDGFGVRHFLQSDLLQPGYSTIILGKDDAQQFIERCRSDRPAASTYRDAALTQLSTLYPSLVWLKQVDDYIATGAGLHAMNALSNRWMQYGATVQSTDYESGGDTQQAALKLSAEDASELIAQTTQQKPLLDPSIHKLQGMFGGEWRRSDADVFTATMSIESAQAAEALLGENRIAAQFTYNHTHAPYNATMTLEQPAAKQLLSLSLAEQTFIAQDMAVGKRSLIAY